MEVFLEESLRDYGFSTLRSLKWIMLVPEIEGKSRLEINVLAYKKGVLLQIQCKSYSRRRKTDPWPGIVTSARYWRKCAEYLAANTQLLLEKIHENSKELYDLVRHEGIRIIVPMVVTEHGDYGVVEGCRAMGTQKFLGEILFLNAWDLWWQVASNREAVVVGDRSRLLGTRIV